MVQIVEGLRHECSLQLRQANLVAEALSPMTMGIVSHVKEDNKVLVKYVHTVSQLIGTFS